MKWMSQTVWFLLPLLGGSLILQLWLYAGYVLGAPQDSLGLLAVLVIVIALLCVLFIRFFCRHLCQRVQLPDWMQMTVTQLSQRLAMAKPELYTLSTEGINAFALGDIRASGVIFFHEQVFAHLTQDEVESVLAHEMAHLASRHAMLMTFLQGMIAPVIVPLAAGASLFVSLLFGIRSYKIHFIHIYHILSVLLFPVTTILIALVMRQWEYEADAMAARLVGKGKYIAALQCLHGSFFQHPDLLSLSSHHTAAAKNDEWALSHPSLKQRIHALRQLGG